MNWYGWERGREEWALAASRPEPCGGRPVQLPSQGQDPTPADGTDVESEHESVAERWEREWHEIEQWDRRGDGLAEKRAWLRERAESAASADERDQEQQQLREDPWSVMARAWEQEQQKGVDPRAGAAEHGVGVGTPGAGVGEVDVPTTPIPVAGAEGRRAEDAGAHIEGSGAGDVDGVCSSSPEHVHTLPDWLEHYRWREEGAREGARYMRVHYVKVGEESYFYDRISGVRAHALLTGEPYEDLS